MIQKDQEATLLQISLGFQSVAKAVEYDDLFLYSLQTRS